MLTLCTSSEEENIPYLQKLAQKIWYSDLAICENIVPRFQASSGLLSPWRNSSKVYAEEFYYSFY